MDERIYKHVRIHARAHMCTRHTHTCTHVQTPHSRTRAQASASHSIRLAICHICGFRLSIEETNQVGNPGQGLSKGRERIKQTVLQVDGRVEYFQQHAQKRYERADCPDFSLRCISASTWGVCGLRYSYLEVRYHDYHHPISSVIRWFSLVKLVSLTAHTSCYSLV
jgi:hypothetical protein